MRTSVFPVLLMVATLFAVLGCSESEPASSTETQVTLAEPSERSAPVEPAPSEPAGTRGDTNSDATIAVIACEEDVDLDVFEVSEVFVGEADRNTDSPFDSSNSNDVIGLGAGAGARRGARLGGQMRLGSASPRRPNSDRYAHQSDNSFTAVGTSALSTFSIDVDTASYANMRRFLRDGELPPTNSIRIEELINYFSYDYPLPEPGDPFSVSTEVSSAPWNPEHRLVRIGLRGRDIGREERRPANLVFLIDVSGSMTGRGRLDLVKQSLKMLVNDLDEEDRVAIVVYAGASGLVLPSTDGTEKIAIWSAVDNLRAGGSTNGGEGIELAYEIAERNRIEGGINRVLLATDGDFNVGTTDKEELVRMVQERTQTGIELSVLGFGRGNLNDSTMESLADKGNGNYNYIDSLLEARKVLVQQIGGTLDTIASDVKLQVEFNPTQVESYRLIGYVNRILAARDFDDDEKDAGEIGAGHRVTAFYEVVPVGMAIEASAPIELRYQDDMEPSDRAYSGELLNIRLRYKRPGEPESELRSLAVLDSGMQIDAASPDFRFATAVVAMGMALRESEERGSASLALVRELVSGSRGADPFGYRREFFGLIEAWAELL